ncbi:hypothetical protein [Methylococcus mesophilus]|uniref:hypothetical protein n=1 Tax=Methylococcus mesophilus TaxID=2993564 RepID=UPI00224B58B9|nr:hypothetical protein [Methylococcus mesophilus]UZR29470.1 hypothetical protein OOT43_02215 [Methylococcus mesophilus]
MQTEATEAIVLLQQAKQLDQAAQEARYAACWLLAACDGWTIQKAAERAGWSKDGLARLVRGIAGGMED